MDSDTKASRGWLKAYAKVGDVVCDVSLARRVGVGQRGSHR